MVAGGGGSGGGGGGFTPPKPTCSLSASSNSVIPGSNVEVHWSSNNAISGTISNGVGPAVPVGNGSKNMIVSNTTTYVGTFIGTGGSKTCSVTVNVTPPNPSPECTLSSSPSSILSGGSSSLVWTTSNASSVSINKGVGSVTPVASGNTSVSPASTTTYQLTAIGSGGIKYCSTTVKVTPPTGYGPYCGDGIVNQSWEACDGGSSCTAQCQNQCVELSFARVVVEDVFNDVGGDLTSDIFLGGSSNKIPQGVWFLVHNGISYITDSDILSYDDVPGIAVQRIAGKIRTRIVGSHPLPGIIREHVAGYIETFQANVTGQENDPTPTVGHGLENGFDGNKFIGARGDEVWLDGGKSKFYLTAVDVDDSFYTLIEQDAPSCGVPKPTCTLSADPTSIFVGDSSTLYWTSTNSTSGSIDNGVGSISPVDLGDTDVSPTSTTNYELTVTGPGGSAVCNAEIGVLPVEPNTPACTLSASPTSIDSGESSTLVWTTVNAGSGATFVIDQGVGSVTPIPTGSIAVSPTVNTTYTGTLDGPNGIATCSASVSLNGSPTPQCTISVSPSTINSGQSVTVSWTSSNMSSGSINGGIGNASPVNSGSEIVFPSDDFEYIGTFTGSYGDATCSAVVDVQTGGGGCTSNCGGGFDQPNVALFKKPGEQPLAFVYLSQIPYTGFEAGVALTILFWFAVILWSLGLTYVFLGKRGMQLIAEKVFSYSPFSNDYENDIDPETSTREDEYINGFSQSVATMPTANSPLPMEELVAPNPTSMATPVAVTKEMDILEDPESIESLIESRAHSAGVLLSPEALSMATYLGGSKEETLEIFGELLNEAVRIIPREDGWILISSDRFEQLSNSRGVDEPIHETKTVASVISETISESIHTRIVAAILSGDRDTAFSLVRSAEKEGINASKLISGVVKAFDSLLQSRASGEAADMILKESATRLSDESLSELVDIFAHALDTNYAAPFTGVKLALAQAFEVS